MSNINNTRVLYYVLAMHNYESVNAARNVYQSTYAPSAIEFANRYAKEHPTEAVDIAKVTSRRSWQVPTEGHIEVAQDWPGE